MARHTGSAIGVTVENTYEYQGHQFDDFDDITTILNFNLNTARDLNSYNRNVEATLKYAVEIARDFVSSTHPSNPAGKYQTTDNLMRSIKYDMTNSWGGNGGRLYADAKDHRGHPYAGHIEYGYTDRGGNPRGPWPFLRPAMRLALSATRYDFAQTMESLMLGEGELSIGSKNARESVRNFYGSTRGATSSIKGNYQSFSDRDHGSGRWGEAYNGIGFKSGESFGYTASGYSWMEGQL